MSRLLVVAGEGSGDAFAAPVVARLGVRTFGLGGPCLARTGTALIADLSSLSVMGLSAPFGRAPRLVRALLGLARAVRRERPRAALLVGFSELNARLSGWLSARGTRVLWYAPPQVWAWRPSRAHALAARCQKLAVVLPFELPIWQNVGANVEYVGHPGLELGSAALPGGSDEPPRIALLPGSRPHEIRAHLERMVGAALKLRERLNIAGATVVCASALDGATKRHVEETAGRAGFAVTNAPLAHALPGHHAAVVASGTATLECALLAVPPVVVYRTDPLTYAVAKRLVRVPHIGLPNLVLGERAFPELIQDAATPERIAAHVAHALRERPARLAACEVVRRRLEAGTDGRSPSSRVADMLSPWLP